VAGFVSSALENFDLFRTIDLDQHGHGIRAAAAADAKISIARNGIHGQVGNQDFLGVDADGAGDFGVDTLHFDGAGRLGGGVAGVDGEDGGALGVADEKNALGPEGQRSYRFEIWFA
jgi:hypothetical protein